MSASPTPLPLSTATPIPPPTADFSVELRDGAAPFTVSFSHTSTGEVSAVRWDFGDGSQSEELSPVHEYTTAGVVDVELNVEGPGGNDSVVRLQLITVRPGPPASLTMVTESLEVPPNQSVQASVMATDEFGNSVSVKPEWEVVNGGGAITSDGTFTAGTLADSFADTIVASLDLGGQALTASADVVVPPGPMESVVLTPLDISLPVGQEWQFSVDVLDQYGNQVTDAIVRWSSPDDAGIVDSNGLFTAGKAAGPFANGVQVDAVKGSYRGKAVAAVFISPGALESVTLEPTDLILERSAEHQFDAAGFDEFGNMIDLAFLWGATGGTIDREGRYKAPDRSGRYEITVVGNDQGATIEAEVEVLVGSPGDLVVTVTYNGLPLHNFYSGEPHLFARLTDGSGERILPYTYDTESSSAGFEVSSTGVFFVEVVAGDPESGITAGGFNGVAGIDLTDISSVVFLDVPVWGFFRVLSPWDSAEGIEFARSLEDVQLIDGSEVVVSWEPVEGADEYRVDVYESSFANPLPSHSRSWATTGNSVVLEIAPPTDGDHYGITVHALGQRRILAIGLVTRASGGWDTMFRFRVPRQ